MYPSMVIIFFASNKHGYLWENKIYLSLWCLATSCKAHASDARWVVALELERGGGWERKSWGGDSKGSRVLTIYLRYIQQRVHMALAQTGPDGNRGWEKVPVPGAPDGEWFAPKSFPVRASFTPSPSSHGRIPCARNEEGLRCHPYSRGYVFYQDIHPTSLKSR